MRSCAATRCQTHGINHRRSLAGSLVAQRRCGGEQRDEERCDAQLSRDILPLVLSGGVIFKPTGSRLCEVSSILTSQIRFEKKSPIEFLLVYAFQSPMLASAAALVSADTVFASIGSPGDAARHNSSGRAGHGRQRQ